MKALWVVMLKELTDLLRDRRTVITALLTGPVLMPVLMIGIGSFAYKKTVTQLEKTLELPVAGAANAPNLIAWLEGQNVRTKPAPADYRQAVIDQKEDMVLVIPEMFGEQWRASKPALLEIVHDATRQDSHIPVGRVENLLKQYSLTVGALRLLARGVSPTVGSPLRITHRDLSTPESRRGQLLAFLPYLLILFSFLGGAHLVIDSTAGERERQSLEPLLATPAARGAIMSGKIAAACAFGLFSLVLMLVGFKLGVGLAPGFSGKLDVSIAAVGKILLTLIPMVLIGTTLLTLISASVKSVKEAQTYMSVLMLLPLIPTIILLVSPVKNELWMLAVPFLAQNQMLMMILRADPVSTLEWAVYLGAGVGTGLLLWMVAARLYRREKLAISA